MPLMIALAVLGGMLLGYTVIPAKFLAGIDTAITYILALMVFLVGIDIGRNREAWRRVKQLGWRLLLVPISIACGSLGGAALAVPLTGMPLKETLAVGAGFGWYSLSGVLIASTYSVELGAVAFLSNVSRELIAFLVIPLLAGWAGKTVAIAPGGATTMDSTLPLITRVTDAHTALLAFMNGLLLTAVVPFLIPLLLAL